MTPDTLLGIIEETAGGSPADFQAQKHRITEGLAWLRDEYDAGLQTRSRAEIEEAMLTLRLCQTAEDVRAVRLDEYVRRAQTFETEVDI